MTRRKSTNHIVVHCSASPPNVDAGVREIREWHVQRGFGRIGYHVVIRRNGKVEYGCPINDIGIHVRGHNSNTVGVCLVGGVNTKRKPEANFTPEQWATLLVVLRDLQRRFPGATILGHRDFPRVAKACPCFPAIDWARKNGLRAAKPMRMVTASMLSKPDAAVEGDERDHDFTDDEGGKTSNTKWAVAGAGGAAGGTGFLATFGEAAASSLGYSLADMMSWQFLVGAAVITGALAAVVFVAMGYERRERLWDRIVGT